ncbi:MAG: MFS transporter [Planctomycetes bacterium]|nr:MFS transporter [Planctomycetota bacterium]
MQGARTSPGWIARLFRGMPRNVVALGVVSLFADAAGDMIAPLLPVFVAGLAGGGPLALGWIEGIADALSSLLKLLAGAWSDRLRKRKGLVVVGYVLAALARPLMALAGAAWHAGAVRALDRTGKGLRTSPRDALLAAAVEPARRGEAFGLHRAMDHAGAVIGPLVAVLLLSVFAFEVREVFWVATIPGALSVVVLLVWVRDEDAIEAPPRSAEPLKPLPSRAMLRFLGPLAVFTLGNASDLFIVLRASESLGVNGSILALPLLWLALHVVKLTSSLYAGRLTDRLGARPLILAGWVVYAAIYGGLAFAGDAWVVVVLSILYGTYHGLTEGAEKALVAELSLPEERGAAYGWYHLVLGVCALPASVAFGFLWQRFGSASSFLTSAALALVACALLLAARPNARARS